MSTRTSVTLSPAGNLLEQAVSTSFDGGKWCGGGALIYSVKQQRLLLAQDEYQNLSDTHSLSLAGNLLEQAVSTCFAWGSGGGGRGSDILC